MNRRQKIIVSVTGIFLVLLLLVGLTYAYFLTQVTGNEKEKSISVSTANLALVYGNDDGSIIGEGEKIEPGKTFEPKTFTVTNQGNATTNYVVVIEILEGTSTFESNDFTYTLTCESGCNGVEEPTTLPMSDGILVGNSIDVGETQTYSFTLTYEETGLDQSIDMNKKLEAKLNIMDKDVGISEFSKLLKNEVINNANKTWEESELRTKYSESYVTIPGQSANSSTERLLLKDSDDYTDTDGGEPTYYFRGDVVDNYVNFAGMCWRIVRIAGDGSIKIILEDSVATCDSTNYTGNSTIGQGFYGHYYIDNNGISTPVLSFLAPKSKESNSVSIGLNSMVTHFYNFQKTLTETIETKYGGETIDTMLKSGGWCLGDKVYKLDENGEYESLTEYDYSIDMYYDSHVRLNNEDSTKNSLTLKCNGTSVNEFDDLTDTFKENEGNILVTKSPMYVGALTADEAAYAGLKTTGNGTKSNYLLNNNFLLLSLANYAVEENSGYTYYVNKAMGKISKVTYTVHSYNLRPVISLSSNIGIIRGNGTKDEPYVVSPAKKIVE